MGSGEIRENGKCSKCGRAMLKIQNAPDMTLYANGLRYIEPNRVTSRWNVFRCECLAVIADTWVCV
jgi:hypothetical protein